MRERALRAGALAGLLGLAGACGSAGPVLRTHHVTIDALAFEPATLTVAVGDTVIWTNQDLVPHTVTAAAAGPSSDEMARDAVFRWVAEAEGTVDYRCAYHPMMAGEVVVEG